MTQLGGETKMLVKEYINERQIRKVLLVTVSFITENALNTAADAAIQVYIPVSSSFVFQI